MAPRYTMLPPTGGVGGKVSKTNIASAYPPQHNIVPWWWSLLAANFALLACIIAAVAYFSWVTRTATVEGLPMVLPLWAKLATTEIANRAYVPTASAIVAYLNTMQMATIVIGLYGLHFVLNIANMFSAVVPATTTFGQWIYAPLFVYGYSQSLMRGLNSARWLVGFNFSGLFLALLLPSVGQPELRVVWTVVALNIIASLFYVSTESHHVEEAHRTPKWQKVEADADTVRPSSGGTEKAAWEAYGAPPTTAHYNDSWYTLTLGYAIVAQYTPYLIYYMPYVLATGIYQADAVIKSPVLNIFYGMLSWSIVQTALYLLFVFSPRNSLVVKEFLWGALNIGCATYLTIEVFRLITVGPVADFNTTLVELA